MNQYSNPRGFIDLWHDTKICSQGYPLTETLSPGWKLEDTSHCFTDCQKHCERMQSFSNPNTNNISNCISICKDAVRK